MFRLSISGPTQKITDSYLRTMKCLLDLSLPLSSRNIDLIKTCFPTGETARYLGPEPRIALSPLQSNVEAIRALFYTAS